ncbi:MAG: hypothetical protein IPN09_00340 [Bacteroidetes bacterium]|nr:hypothetical protein [Bacteroidota bacterium]
MKKIAFLLLFLICFALANFAQLPPSFPEADAEFVSTMQDMLKKTGRDDAKENAQNFASIFGSLPQEQKDLIKKISNVGLQKSIRPYPEFNNFLKTIVASTKSPLDATTKENNLKVLFNLIDLAKKGTYKEFTQYNEFLLPLYSDNYINDTKSKAWNYSGAIAVFPDGINTYLKLNGGNLAGFTNKDTVTIIGTNGKYYPLSSKWEGEKGMITWQRSGLEDAEATFTFGNHTLNLDESDIRIPEGKLSLKPYLDFEITGNFADKIMNSKSNGNMVFPQFQSAENNLILDKIGSQFKFFGGFRLEGPNIYGSGNDSMRATVILFNPKKDTMATITARRFLIVKFQDVLANDANAIVNFKGAKIWHPYVNFRYNLKTKETKLNRENPIYAKMPFKSDFQQMDFYVNQLAWNLDSSFIKMNAISATGDNVAKFDSYNYYVKGAEEQFRGISDRDPLAALKTYYDRYGSKDIDAEEAASLINPSLKLPQVEALLYKMASEGFIFYDKENYLVRILDKTINYIRAGANLQDFDNLSFQSFARTTHGKVNLLTKEIEIYGVRELKFSKSKNVVFTPSSDTIIIGEDRDITMSGMLTAGKVNFYSKKLNFDYKGFQFEFENIDSMFILIPGKTPDQNGNFPYIECQTAIQNVSGTLFLDKEDNKSGRKNDAKYPYFVCKDSAYVYYDNYPHKDKYTRNSFYFLIEPFQFDSLNSFNTDSVGFPGKLISAGIFEPFAQQLTVQEDLSLGFKMKTPATGFSMYKGKANYIGELHLENAGLFGSGDIQFQSATMHGKEFDIFPDSVFADLDSFEIQESKKYNMPQTHISTSFLKWNPLNDSLRIFRTGDVFSMYNDIVAFKGDLTMGKDYLIGTGILDWEKANLTAANIDFKAREFFTKKGDLKVKANDGDAFAFATKNVNANVNFDSHIAKININEPNTITELPANKYQTNSEHYDWDMKNHSITFKNEKSANNIYFQSIDKSMDSIQFSAKEVFYSLDDYILKAKGVSEIQLADSKAIPDKGELTVDKTGKFSNLINATLLLNKDTLFHTIKEAEIEIFTKNKFNAKGILNITTPSGNIQKVNIPELNVLVDTVNLEKRKKENLSINYYCKGRGYVEENDNFKIDSRIRYKGDVLFNSKERNILLDGFAQVNFGSDSSDWFGVKQDVNFKRAVISVDSIYNEQKEPLITGIMLSREGLEVYPSIMKAKFSSKDIELFRSKGVMQYNVNKQVFQFGDDETIKGDYPYGNLLNYSEYNKDIKAFGQINFGANTNPVKLNAFGEAIYNPKTGKTNLNCGVGLDFFLDETLWPTIFKGLAENNSGNVTLPYNTPLNQKIIYNFIPNKTEAITTVTNIQSGGTFQVPLSLDYNILLTDLNFTFDQEEGTWKSFDKAGLAVMGKRAVSQKINCYMEIGYRGSRDFINLYLETSTGDWYFFRYFEGQLGIISSQQVFNDNLALIKPEKTQLKDKKDIIYEYLPATLGIKQSFIDRMDEAKIRLKN